VKASFGSIRSWLRRAAAVLGAASVLAAGGAAGAATHLFPYPANAVPLGKLVPFATCGFPRLQCAPGVLGHTSTVEPSPERIGRFVEVSLIPWIQAYGADVVAPQPAKPLPGNKIYPKLTPYGGSNGPGIGGNVLPSQFFPSTGTWQVNIQGLVIPFLIPDWGLGVPSAMPVSFNATIPVPHGRYLVAWFLGTGTYGSQTANITLNYADGTSQQIPLTYPDWCSGAALPPYYPAIVTPYRLHPNGAKGTNICGAFYAEFVPTNPNKTLVSISLPNTTPNMYLMALTLEAASGLAPAPVPPPHVAAPKRTAAKA
jgi:hypothetical protein